MEKYGYIYLTTNNVNKLVYVGQHVATEFNPKYKGSGLILKRAIKKYGNKNFKSELIEWCYSQEELDQKEDYWILKYDSNNPEKGYNIKRGGSHGKHSIESIKLMSDNAKKAHREPWNKGKTGVYSEEVRKSISNSLHLYASGEKAKSNHPRVKDGKILSEEEYQKGFIVCSEEHEAKKKKAIIRNKFKNTATYNGHPTTRKERQEIYELTDHSKVSFFGRHHTEETKRKISESEKGKILSEETKNKISITSIERAKTDPNYGMRGKHHSEEAKKKISEYQTLYNHNRGKSPSEETRKKISEAKKGKKMSEEFKENCRQRMTGRKHSKETIEKIRQKNLNKIVSEETRKKISESKKGKKLSEEAKKHLSEVNKGRKWITNGKENIVVNSKKVDEYKHYFEEGWYYGFTNPNPKEFSAESLNKIRQSKQGTKWINNGIEQKYVKIEELDNYLNTGWKLGMLPQKKTNN